MTDAITEAAARWHAAQADDAMDWDGFTVWLEESPAHRTAYDAVALLDDRIDRAVPALRDLMREDEPVRPRGRLRLVGWGAAAAVLLVGAIGLGTWHTARPGAAEVALYRAPAGQTRAVALPNGSRATLAPGATLRVSAGAQVALEGKGYFEIRHDPAHPFTVTAGAYQIRDIGTRFELVSDAGMLRVAVAEGTVGVTSRAANGEVLVSAGRTLTAFAPDQFAEVRTTPPAPMAAWRGGRFSYDNEPLGLVVADISRYVGAPVLIDGAPARRRFSGIIAPGSRAVMVRNLEQLTGLDATTEGDAIRLGDRTGG
ncbi:FecR family protein [Sphingomonas sp. NFR15]|uniref:FecR family protein n=1 Tax=Sphingomonas sp. NFR15 TaxID=1566282 RepID=UPI00088BDBBC|nr:FecR domain-containing protein [Sphingomonas sp. NFR15]SDA22637.1 FecR family protein [Sphingomonas sp. NFR15]